MASQEMSPLELILEGLAKTANLLSSQILEDIHPIEFQLAIKEVSNRFNVVKIKELSNFEQQSIRDLWASIKSNANWQDIKKRDVRDLISVSEIFCDDSIFQVIQHHSLASKRLLATVVRSYISYWADINYDNRQKWALLIKDAFNDSSLNNLPWEAFHHWKAIASWLLSDNADQELANVLFHSSSPIDIAMQDYLKSETFYSEKSLGNLSRKHLLNAVLNLDANSLYDKIDQAFKHWLKPSEDHSWLSSLVIHLKVLGDEVLIEKVKDWFLKSNDYGDLRLKPHGNWYHISDEAKAIFSNWLSKEDLEFFFKMVLPEREDPHNRREFWEQYLPSVIRSRVLISGEDEAKNRFVLTEMRTKGKTLPGKIRQSSVFVMETKQCYILEFSEVNNAAYIYWKSEEKLYSTLHRKLEALLQYKVIHELSAQDLKLSRLPSLSKNNDCIEHLSIRSPHPTGWQYMLRKWLNTRNIRLEGE